MQDKNAKNNNIFHLFCLWKHPSFIAFPSSCFEQIYSFKYPGQHGNINLQRCFAGWRFKPFKCSLFETFVPYAKTGAVPEQYFAFVAEFVEEDKQMAAERIRGIERKVQRYERWGEMPLSKVRFSAILAALVGAAIGYLPIWVVFGIISWVIVPSVSKFIRWLALGFRDDMAEQVVNVEQTLEHESENLEKENPVPEQAPVGWIEGVGPFFRSSG